MQTENTTTELALQEHVQRLSESVERLNARIARLAVALDVALGNLGAAFTCIGQMSADVEGIHFTRDGKSVTFDWKGYDHFAAP